MPGTGASDLVDASRSAAPFGAVIEQVVPDAGTARMPQVPARVLLVCSSGGHLAQLISLRPWWSVRHRHWVTFGTTDARGLLDGEAVSWAHHPTTRNVPNLLRNLFLAARVVWRERPDMVVSTGAGVALPFFVLARMRGIPTVFIEVYDRLDSLTLTQRLCGPFTTMTCAQWDEQRRFMPDAEVIGRLL